jgi:ERCC4 domain
VYLSVCCIPDISLQCDIRLFSLSLSHHFDQSAYLKLILFPPLLQSPSSIVDGRYNEQKHRLQECGLRSCLYIVEGLSLTGEHSNSHSQSDLTSHLFISCYIRLSPYNTIFLLFVPCYRRQSFLFSLYALRPVLESYVFIILSHTFLSSLSIFISFFFLLRSLSFDFHDFL